MSIHSQSSVPLSPSPACQIQPPDNVAAIDTPGFSRNSEALDIFYITSSEPSFKSTENCLRYEAVKSGVPMQAIYVEDLLGPSREEKNDQLKQYLRQLRAAGKIDRHTQIAINLHGSIVDGPHVLFNGNTDFFVGTRELVSLIREALAFLDTAEGSGAWKGSVHVSACGSGRATEDLTTKSGYTLLYGGRKVKLHSDSKAVFLGMICRLAQYRKDLKNNAFPNARDLYESASAISGEKVSLVGDGNAFHFRSGYLPPLSALCRPAVMEKLQRSLIAKLAHGKISHIEKMATLLRQGMQDIKIPAALINFACLGGSYAEEKLGILVRSGVDVDQPINGFNALQYAISHNNKEMVRLLLKHGADISKKNDYQVSAMSVAIHFGNLDIVEMLIDCGADIADVDAKGKTAVVLAFEKFDLRRIHRFSELYFSKVPLGDKIGQVPTEVVLDFLLVHGQIATYRLLMSKSRDPAGLTRKLCLLPEYRHKDSAQTLESVIHAKNFLLIELLKMTPITTGAHFPEIFEDYFISIARDGTFYVQELLDDMLESPDLVEKWSESLKSLSDRLSSLGLIDASEFVEAALALKFEIGVSTKQAQAS